VLDADTASFLAKLDGNGDGSVDRAEFWNNYLSVSSQGATKLPLSGATCITHQGKNRCWVERAPAQQGQPLVIDLHGNTDGALSQATYGLGALAGTHGFGYVAADGYMTSWNADVYCCCMGASVGRGEDFNKPCETAFGDQAVIPGGMDDVGFIAKLISNVTARFGSDRSRVYLAGCSNGCGLAQRIAVELPGLIAAVACTGYFFAPPDAIKISDAPSFSVIKHPALPPDAKPVDRPAIMMVAGVNEQNNFFGLPRFPEYRGACAHTRMWADVNGCSTEVNVNDFYPSYVNETYTNCTGGEVALLSYQGGHCEYYTTDGFDISPHMWKFLESKTSRRVA
jgi:poly(3-hydroxybutyrate) depolymerase